MLTSQILWFDPTVAVETKIFRIAIEQTVLCLSLISLACVTQELVKYNVFQLSYCCLETTGNVISYRTELKIYL